MNRSFWTAATLVGLGREQPGEEVVHARTTRRRSSSGSRQHGKTWKVYVLEPMPLSFAGVIHYSTVEGRLATHFVPFAEFEKDAAPERSRLLTDRAEHVSGHGDYHPAAGRSFLGGNEDLAIDSPVVGARRRGVPRARLQRLPPASPRRLERLEHGAADRLGRAGRNLRPRPSRARCAARPRCTGRRDGLHLRPLRLPRPGHPRLAVGRVGLGLQRGVPPHVADRDAAEGLGARRARSRSATPRRAPSTTSSRARRPAIPTPGRTSKHSPCPTGRWTTTWSTRPSAASVRR